MHTYHHYIHVDQSVSLLVGWFIVAMGIFIVIQAVIKRDKFK